MHFYSCLPIAQQRKHELDPELKPQNVTISVTVILNSPIGGTIYLNLSFDNQAIQCVLQLSFFDDGWRTNWSESSSFTTSQKMVRVILIHWISKRREVDWNEWDWQPQLRGLISVQLKFYWFAPWAFRFLHKNTTYSMKCIETNKSLK